jgi:hypothetical protein
VMMHTIIHTPGWHGRSTSTQRSSIPGLRPALSGLCTV